MLKKIFTGIAALVVAYVFLILYSTAKKCISEELKATAAEEALNSSDVVLVKNSKAACHAEVAGMLNSRRIGYQEIKTIYRGKTQIYSDVFVGVYGTETAGQLIRTPSLSLSCLVAPQGKSVLRVDVSREVFDASRDSTDPELTLQHQIFSNRLNATVCKESPENLFYRMLK